MLCEDVAEREFHFHLKGQAELHNGLSLIRTALVPRRGSSRVM